MTWVDDELMMDSWMAVFRCFTCLFTCISEKFRKNSGKIPKYFPHSMFSGKVTTLATTLSVAEPPKLMRLE